MRTKPAKILVLVGATILALAGEARSMHKTYELSKDVPGQFYVDLAVDSQGKTYLVTAEHEEPDTLSIDPLDPSSLMRISVHRRFLRYDPDSDKFTNSDSTVPPGEQYLFAPDGKLWVRSGETVICRIEEADSTVLDLRDNEGLFRSMALGEEGNLWVGGLKTGLYRISPNLEWTHFTKDNSDLPSSSMTNIHVAGPREIWIAMWYNVGVWRGTGSLSAVSGRLEGTVFDASSTGMPLQTVWSMASDAPGQVWFGSGGFLDQPASLVRFDGAGWSQRELAPACADSVPGSVRRLVWDGTKLWVQASLGARTEARKSCVTTLVDGHWSAVPEIPPDADVLDIEASPQSQWIWVVTIETAQRRTILHRFSR